MMHNHNEEPDTQETAKQRTGCISRMMLWLIVLGLGCLLIPLNLTSTRIKSEVANVEVQLADIQATLEGGPAADSQTQTLTDTLTQTRAIIGEIKSVQSDLTANHINWPAAMAVINNYDRGRIEVTGFTQTENRLILTGHAVDEVAVTSYAGSIEDSSLFDRAIVQSIQLSSLSSEPAQNPEVVIISNTQGKYVDFSVLLTVKRGATSDE